MTTRRIAITGADGFIGRNLSLRLTELGDKCLPLVRESSREDWVTAVSAADVVVHLAGANRPADPNDFQAINTGTTELLTTLLAEAGRHIPVIYSSSIRATGEDVYGQSKRDAEQVLLDYAKQHDGKVYLIRLPNVFGKWARPNYNSAVATFCHNIARDLPISIHDPSAPLNLIYIDDVIELILKIMDGGVETGLIAPEPVYSTTVGEVAQIIRGFREDRSDNLIDTVGTGLKRALYATYVAALPTEAFSYAIASHRDPRGAFSEMLKTRTSGQFSYFTALPGVTRGGHYHHTKTEKFLVVHGKARFGFRNMVTGETHEIMTSGDAPEIVETVPGWAHDITNVGDDVLISLLWANEIFDRSKPDTIAAKV